MNIILIENNEINEDSIIVFHKADRRYQHILNVLHLEENDEVRMGVVNGGRFLSSVVSIDEESCVLKYKEDLPLYERTHLDLLLALPRPKCLKRLLPQLTTIGFENIYLTNAEKVEKNYWGSRNLVEEEYMPLLYEGLEQSGDTILPKIELVKRLKPFVEDVIREKYKNSLCIVAHPYTDDGLLNSFKNVGERVILAIGPEGGWSDFEINLFKNNGFHTMSLGERILRSDTACISLAATVNALISAN